MLHGQTLKQWPWSTCGAKLRCNRNWEERTKILAFFPLYPKSCPPTATPAHQSSVRPDWRDWKQTLGSATKTSMWVCSSANRKRKCNFFYWFLVFFFFVCLLFSFCSLREQEQNECKFYNELGQFLVKDFTPVPQMNKMTEEYDDDFSAFSQQDTGLYCHLHVIGGKGRNWLWWFKVYLYKESLNYII